MSLDGFGWNLLLAAASVAFVHTILGPDHYLPFVMLGQARRWSRLRTVAVTALCGAGHVASSLLLGGIGIALGLTVGSLEQLEAGRGDWAAWSLIAFGGAYALWGVRRAVRHRRGIEAHAHDHDVHVHAGATHRHHHGHVARSGSFWAMFAIFVLGPCEPMIPLFIVPASRGRWGLAALCAAVFTVVTIATMVGAALAGLAGIRRVSFAPLERWSHALAGGVIAASGLAIVTLGL